MTGEMVATTSERTGDSRTEDGRDDRQSAVMAAISRRSVRDISLGADDTTDRRPATPAAPTVSPLTAGRHTGPRLPGRPPYHRAEASHIVTYRHTTVTPDSGHPPSGRPAADPDVPRTSPPPSLRDGAAQWTAAFAGHCGLGDRPNLGQSAAERAEGDWPPREVKCR